MESFPDDNFLMVTQCEWEKEIIWDGADEEVKKQCEETTPRSTWVLREGTSRLIPYGRTYLAPNPNYRITAAVPSTLVYLDPNDPKGLPPKEECDEAVKTWYSIFPVDSADLIHRPWENDIIWDAENVDELPEPRGLVLDPTDDNLILEVPEDLPPAPPPTPTSTAKSKIQYPHGKKSKLMLGKAGCIEMARSDSPPPSPSPLIVRKDPYNLSLDEYYQVTFAEKALMKTGTPGTVLRHALPVLELSSPYVPTFLNLAKLRKFHRPALKRYSRGLVSGPGPHSVAGLLHDIQKNEKEREVESEASGGGDIFLMRSPADITGKDGELLLVEYSEEHPALLGLVGMCSKINNYYKRTAGADSGPGSFEYGETVYAHTSPFLGSMSPGQMLQTLENNLYRVPIYSHSLNMTDFLIIRTRDNYYIRTIDGLFTGGQQCPSYEVPGPNSKRAFNFTRDFLQVFIYRLFWKSQDDPKRIRMQDIQSAFPETSESAIRKRLKCCAEFKRTGADSNWWVLKDSFRLPPEEELRALVTPEQCCAYFGLVVSEQRLKDAGYGEQSFLASVESGDEDDGKKLEDEVKTAAWNTTRAYIQAVKGKCTLQLDGPADPTGCGEGFSYIRMPNKPQLSEQQKESPSKKIVTGTDADLRRLSLQSAKALLRKFNVPDEEINKLSRWEVIDVVRTLSTEKSKSLGEEEKQGVSKFSRGRCSVAEYHVRYREECQRIFDLQNHVLHSAEILSSDEYESSEEEEEDEAEAKDIEEMGRNIEKMITNFKTSADLSHEREEEERLELQKMIMGDGLDNTDKSAQLKTKAQEHADELNLNGLTTHPNRLLKISRTYKGPDGGEYTRTEIVRKPTIIDIYMRIRTTKDEKFVRKFATLDDEQKKSIKMEKRRIQEQLRRLRNIDKPARPRKVRAPLSPSFLAKRKKAKEKKQAVKKVTCSGCGQVGHMKTNKDCPKFGQAEDLDSDTVPSINVAMTKEEEDEIEKEIMKEENDLVKIDGTKVQISRRLFRHAENVKRRSLLIKVPKEMIALSKKRKRQAVTEPHCDYLDGKTKSINRRRMDPKVLVSNLFEEILNELRKVPESEQFRRSVSAKIPRYHEIISSPMDLTRMRGKNREYAYHSRVEFLSDMQLMLDNSTKYNGQQHILTTYAQMLYDIALERLNAADTKLTQFEKQIQADLDENMRLHSSYTK